jgi:hypothetical protein
MQDSNNSSIMVPIRSSSMCVSVIPPIDDPKVTQTTHTLVKTKSMRVSLSHINHGYRVSLYSTTNITFSRSWDKAVKRVWSSPLRYVTKALIASIGKITYLSTTLLRFMSSRTSKSKGVSTELILRQARIRQKIVLRAAAGNPGRSCKILQQP